MSSHVEEHTGEPLTSHEQEAPASLQMKRKEPSSPEPSSTSTIETEDASSFDSKRVRVEEPMNVSSEGNSGPVIDMKRQACKHYVAGVDFPSVYLDTSRPLRTEGEPYISSNSTTSDLTETEIESSSAITDVEILSHRDVLSRAIAYPAHAAKTYPFQLDQFQKRSIAVLEQNENLMVSAHTSAGKTVVAEYAIARALAANQRIIYTSPIKALSNQKYHDLLSEFSSVGLMTGDFNINTEASVLVMTTEILRNMVVLNNSVITETGCVIFDEVHYMCDRERGVVWEESIVLMPPAIQLVFLSATVSNSDEFADWVSFLKKVPCHVISTNYRPTPLRHFYFPKGASKLRLLVDGDGILHPEALEQAGAEVDRAQITGHRDNRKKASSHTVAEIRNVLKEAQKRDWFPVISFSFNRRECDAYGYGCIGEGLNFNSPREAEMVDTLFDAALDGLPDEDKALPAFEQMRGVLRKGIGIHHSGLIALLRELVEKLFENGLIKVLFATETFAMGVNMPARSVLFTTLRKFDGRSTRFVSSSEYTQMSGRAGRRNKDAFGNCIILAEEKIDAADVRAIIQGNALPLESRFRLSYNMILALLVGNKGIDSLSVIRRSLAQFLYNRSFEAAGKGPIALLTAVLDAYDEASKRALEATSSTSSAVLSALKQAEKAQALAEAEAEAQTRATKASTSGALVFDAESVAARLSHEDISSLRGLRDVLSDYALCADVADQLLHAAHDPSNLLHFLQPGRLVKLRDYTSTAASSTLEASLKTLTPSSQAEKTLIDAIRASGGLESVPGKDFGWAVVLNVVKRYDPASFTLDVLVPVLESTKAVETVEKARFSSTLQVPVPVEPLWSESFFNSSIPNASSGGRGSRKNPNKSLNQNPMFEVVNIDFRMVSRVSAVRLTLPDDIGRRTEYEQVFTSAMDAHKIHLASGLPGAFPLLSPLDDMGIDIKSLPLGILEEAAEAALRLRTYPVSLRSSPVMQGAAVLEENHHAALRHARRHAFKEASTAGMVGVNVQVQASSEHGDGAGDALVTKSASDAESLVKMFQKDLETRVRVLEKLEYFDKEGLISAKGRFASEINGVDELVLTELVFDGTFSKLDYAEMCGLLSCMFQFEKSRSDSVPLLPNLAEPYQNLLKIVERVAKASNECGQVVDEQLYLGSFKQGLMNICYHWATESTFVEICKMTDMFPGSIIRILRRLTTLLAQLQLGAERIGDQDLVEKFKQAQIKTQRGLPFAGSLYTA